LLVANDQQIAVAAAVVVDLVDMIVKDAAALAVMEEVLAFDGVLNDWQGRCVPRMETNI
jgi:hypothetical protein